MDVTEEPNIHCLKAAKGSPPFLSSYQILILDWFDHHPAPPPPKKSGDEFEYFIEMACNGMFGAGNNGLINPPLPDKSFVLKTAELVLINPRIHHLFQDLKILYDFAKEMPSDSLRGRQALFAANAAINAYIPGDPSSLEPAGFPSWYFKFSFFFFF